MKVMAQKYIWLLVGEHMFQSPIYLWMFWRHSSAYNMWMCEKEKPYLNSNMDTNSKHKTQIGIDDHFRNNN